VSVLNASRLGRLTRSAREAGDAIRTAFRTGGAEAERALNRINNENFRKLVGAAIRAALAIRQAFKRLAENVDIEESILRSGRAFRTLLLATVGLGAMAVRLAAAASAAGGLIAALAPGVGILAALPSAIALFTAASSTLKVALLGVGDAVKAAFGDDAKAFEESLKKLSPAAQKTAREFRALKPAVDGLRKSVQDAFFKPLEGQIRKTGAALIGPLKKGMSGASAEFGRLGAAVLKFGQSRAAVDLVKGTFAQLKTQLGGIKSGTITGLLTSIAKFTTSVFPAFNNLGGGIDGVVQKLTGFLTKATKSGDALRWVTEALAVFRQLGRIVANVGSVLAAVFNAIRANGGGALGTIENVTKGLADFAKSAEGGQTLGTIFQTIATIGAQAGPVILALVKGVGQLAPIIGELALQTGPILTDAIGAVVPALAGLGKGLVVMTTALRGALANFRKSGALGEFGRAVGVLLAALSPLITALGKVLVSAFRATAVAARIVAPVLGLLAKGIELIARSPIGIFLGVLVAQLVLVRVVTGNWTVALKSLVPVLRLAGKAVLGLGRALIAAVVANPITAAIAAVVLVLGFLLTRLQPVRDALGRLRDIVVDAFGRLKAFGSALVATFKTDGPVAALKKLADGVVGLATGAADKLAEFGPKIARAVLAGIESAIAALPGLLAKVGGLISAGVQRVGQALPAIGKFYVKALVAEFNLVRTVIPVILRGVATAVVGIFGALKSEGPKIAAQLGDLLSSAFDTVAAQGPGLISRGFSFLKDGTATILTFAASAIRGLGDFLAANIPLVADKISAGVTALVGFIGRAIPQILNGLTGLISGGIDKSVGDAAAGVAGGGGGGEKLKTSLGGLLLDVLGALIEQIPKLIPVVIQAVAQIQLALLTALAKAAPGILLALGQLILTAAGALLSALGSFLASLPGTLLSLLGSLVTSLASLGAQAMFALLNALVTGVGTVIGFVVSIPILIVAALASLGIKLYQLGVQAIQKLRDSFAPAGESIPQIFARLPGRIIAALGSLAGRLAALAVAALVRMGVATLNGIGKVVSFFKGLKGKVLGALSNFGSALYNLGKDLMQGAINGVKALASSFVNAVAAPIKSAIKTANSLLGRKSPSKVFKAIGQDVGRGFILGVTGTEAKIKSTMEKLIKDVIKAFSGKKSKVDDTLVKSLSAQEKQLVALARSRAKVADLFKKATDFAASVASNAKSFASITNVTATAENGVITGADIEKQLAERLNAIRKFQANLNDLAKRGLNKSTLQQLAEAGVEQGGNLAAALKASTNTTLNNINATSKAIDKASTKLGKSTADLLFDAGTQAGKGFLAGLKGQQAAITKLMTEIGKQAAAAVKKALKIKSPSQVMEKLGGFTVEGFLDGIAALAPDVAKALASAVAIRESLARRLEAAITPGAVGSAASTTAAPSSLTAPKTATDSLASIAAALERLVATTSTGVKSVEVQAPITVNLPTADPEAAAAIVSRRISNLATR
jgi:hypothetical protein